MLLSNHILGSPDRSIGAAKSKGAGEGGRGTESLTGQGQGLGEPQEGDVIVVLLISVIAIDDDLGDRGSLRQLAQVAGASIHLPALQDLLPGPS